MKKELVNQELLRFELLKVLKAGLKSSAISNYTEINHIRVKGLGT